MSKNKDTGLRVWIGELESKLSTMRGLGARQPDGTWNDFTHDLISRGWANSMDGDNLRMEFGELIWSVWGKTEADCWMTNEAAVERMREFNRKTLTARERTSIAHVLRRWCEQAKLDETSVFPGELVTAMKYGGWHISAVLTTWELMFPNSMRFPVEARYSDGRREIVWVWRDDVLTFADGTTTVEKINVNERACQVLRDDQRWGYKYYDVPADLPVGEEVA